MGARALDELCVGGDPVAHHLAAIGPVRPRDALARGAARSLARGGQGEREDLLSQSRGGVLDPDEAADYHRPQVEAFARAGADLVAAYTLTGAEEGMGIARAARAAGVPVLVGFTVETDGRLPDGTTLADAIARVDAADAPDGYVVNCAHPIHIAPGLAEGDWRARIVQVNPNASTQTHEELDAAEELDTGDLELLRTSYDALRPSLPSLRVVGGCCGTAASHVAALWGV